MLVRRRPSVAISRFGLHRDAAAAVEFAFVCVPLFILIMAALELGRAMMVLAWMSNAARAACRYAVVQPPPQDGTNALNIETTVGNTMKTAMVYSVGVHVYYYTPTSGNYTAPGTGSTWNPYPTSAQTAPYHPQSSQGDYVRVTVRVNAKDMTWVPVYWFLGSSQAFAVSEDMAMEY